MTVTPAPTIPSSRRRRASDELSRRLLAAVLTGSIGVSIGAALVGCADDPGDAREPTTDRSTPAPEPVPAATSSMDAITTTTTTESPSATNRPATNRPATNQPATSPPTTSEPPVAIPPGVLVAIPQQNREDPAKGQFQLQFVNDTDARFAVRSVQFLWAGFSSPVTSRDSQIVGGQTIDFPVPFEGATCTGDGTIATMPSLEGARAQLGLDDGSLLEVPVIDRWHLARRLYVEDCQRQSIAAAVTIEWAELRRAEHEGRPVTEGVLRLTRGSSTDTISVASVSGTIPYGVETIDVDQGDTVIELGPSDDSAETRIRFVESRCDPHALAEVKQPHKFVAQVDLGDGVLVPFIVVPPEADWVPMRLTADEACVLTGQVVFVGEEGDVSAP